jgi:hypothetical protein
MDILIDQFELKQIGWFRGVMNADDVIGILHHHWVLCNDYYPEERQRLQHAVYEHLLCIHHGASRNRYRVKLLLWTE